MNDTILKEEPLYHFMAGTGVPHICALLGRILNVWIVSDASKTSQDDLGNYLGSCVAGLRAFQLRVWKLVLWRGRRGLEQDSFEVMGSLF